MTAGSIFPRAGETASATLPSFSAGIFVHSVMASICPSAKTASQRTLGFSSLSNPMTVGMAVGATFFRAVRAASQTTQSLPLSNSRMAGIAAGPIFPRAVAASSLIFWSQSFARMVHWPRVFPRYMGSAPCGFGEETGSTPRQTATQLICNSTQKRFMAYSASADSGLVKRL